MFAVALAAALSAIPALADPALTFTKLWTHDHTAPGQSSEIPAFDDRTNTLWVAGVVGVDVLDAETGELVAHIDVDRFGVVNSVAIHNGLAALAVEAASQSAAGAAIVAYPGKVLFYDTATRQPTSGVNEVDVGSLPDMLTFTHDGSKLLVANEATPNAVADTPRTPRVDPRGHREHHRHGVAYASSQQPASTACPTSGDNLRLTVSTGMDFEPEYIAVEPRRYAGVRHAPGSERDRRARSRVATRSRDVIGLGAKDFNLPGNAIDPKDNDDVVSFQNVSPRKASTCPTRRDLSVARRHATS